MSVVSVILKGLSFLKLSLRFQNSPDVIQLYFLLDPRNASVSNSQVIFFATVTVYLLVQLTWKQKAKEEETEPWISLLSSPLAVDQYFLCSHVPRHAI